MALLLLVMCVAVPGTARAGSSATQTIHLHFGALSRASLESSVVALSASREGRPEATPAGQVQGEARLAYLRNVKLRLLVGASGGLPAGSALEVQLSGTRAAVRLGGADLDLTAAGLLPPGDHTLNLQYVLTGAQPGSAAPRVVYTLLDP